MKKDVQQKVQGTQGRLDYAKEQAAVAFDEWNDITGFPEKHTGYYYELKGLIADAVEIGFGVANGYSINEIKNIIKKREA